MNARFYVKKSFSIHNRGFAIAGRILEGVINPGMKIEISTDCAVQIKSVEGIKDNSGKANVGIIFEPQKDVEIEDLLKFDLTDTEIMFFDK